MFIGPLVLESIWITHAYINSICNAWLQSTIILRMICSKYNHLKNDMLYVHFTPHVLITQVGATHTHVTLQIFKILFIVYINHCIKLFSLIHKNKSWPSQKTESGPIVTLRNRIDQLSLWLWRKNIVLKFSIFFPGKIYSNIMYLLKFWIIHDFGDFIDSTEIFIHLNR